jgi:GT2 family glycosyltransferase
MTTSYGCIVLTQGRRPDALRRCVDSLLRQRGVEVDVVAVGNGCDPAPLPDGVRTVALAENVGAAGGRNAGVPHVRGGLLLFLDDDANLADDDALSRLAHMFAAEPRLGAVQPRIVDSTNHRPPRQWVPRLRVGDPTRSSDAATLCEGAVVVRRDAFEDVGGWPAQFFYLHEGIDLAWRIWDLGYRVRYAGDVIALHPAPAASPHPDFHYLTSRNRVWLARRNLPMPLATAHVVVWFLRTAARVRSRRDAREVLRGHYDGLREAPSDRRSLRWSTIWRLTLAGRPPIV